MGKEQMARQIYLQSSRTQKPITVIEAGGAELVGLHDPKSDRNEMYNRIKSHFLNAAGGTIILKNIQLLNFEKQSVFLHILSVSERTPFISHFQKYPTHRFVLQLKFSYFCAKIKPHGNKRKTDSPFLGAPQ